LVTWNTPFMFLPDADQTNRAGFGGAFGIGITLQFVSLLPRLLTPYGRAVLVSASPIMMDGSDRLQAELEALASHTSLDVTLEPSRVLLVHLASRLSPVVRRGAISQVVLEITHGAGIVRAIGPGPVKHAPDALRRARYEHAGRRPRARNAS
jgi:hypothetical protein